MPFDFLQKMDLGKRKPKEVYKQAQELFEAYIWSPANFSSGQYGGDYIKLTDVKTSAVAGGASIAGTQVRVLNTKDSDTGGNCTLSSNQFTLLAGTYRIQASAPGHATTSHKCFLYNVTDTANTLIGSAEYNASPVANRSFVVGEFTIAASKVFELRHYTAVAVATNGLGLAVSDGSSEIYSMVELWKII